MDNELITLPASGHVKDWNYIREKLDVNEIAIYELRHDVLGYRAEDDYRTSIQSLKFPAACIIGSVAGLAASIYFLSLPFAALSVCSAFCFSMNLNDRYVKREVPDDLSGWYAKEILNKFDIRPSLVKFKNSGNREYVSFKDNIYIVPDLNELRSDNLKGKTIIIGGVIKSKSDSVYSIETDDKSIGFFGCYQNKITIDGTHKFNTQVKNISRDKISASSRNELSAYLDACIKDGRKLLIGGRLLNHASVAGCNFISYYYSKGEKQTLTADLFRDEFGNGFDIYLKND